MSEESNQSTSVQEGLSEAADSAEQAVESNSQEAGESQEAEQAQETLADPNAPKAAKVAAQKQLRKLKLKVDGEEQDFEYDPDDMDYMTKQFQLAKVAQKRMAEKSSIEKEVVKFIEDLRKNPRKALSDPAIGIDIKQLAKSIIEEEIANSKKSPEQLKAEQLEAELKSIKEEREKEKTDSQQREFERIKEEAYERYDIAMSSALEKSDLPKSPYVVKKMADYMLLGLQNGKDVSPEDVLPLVREEIQEDLKAMFQSMPEDAIEAMIGKDIFNRVRRKNIAKAKAAPAAVKSNKVMDSGKKAEAPKKEEAKQTFKDYFKF